MINLTGVFVFPKMFRNVPFLPVLKETKLSREVRCLREWLREVMSFHQDGKMPAEFPKNLASTLCLFTFSTREFLMFLLAKSPNFLWINSN